MIDATSTPTQIRAEILTCRLYAVDGDVAKARRLLVACQAWLLLPAETRDRDGSAALNHAALEKLMGAAETFVAAQGGFTRLRPVVLATNDAR
jgi:hypothetical protein